MHKIVVKFGGSNLKTPRDVRRSAAVAAAYRRPLVVVVSAFSGVTDSLLRAMDGAGGPLSRIDDFRAALRRIHQEALDAQLGTTTPDRERADGHRSTAGRPLDEADDLKRAAMAVVDIRLEELDRLLRGIHYIGAAPDFVRDAVLACGERLSAPVMVAVLRGAGLDAAEALPEDIGLRTDGTYGAASALVDEGGKALAEALAPERIFVVPGFYGVGPHGRTTVFGRGGSDYTAAVIARCVGAESLDLWKDVDGFLSCDPRIVPRSRTIPRLGYDEAAELSYFGAKVLHPRTVEPLQDVGIPIRVMNVERFSGEIAPYSVVGPRLEREPRERPEEGPAGGSGRVGTMDHTEAHPNETAGPSAAAALPDGTGSPASGVGGVKSVASSDDVAVVRLEGPGVGFRAGILARATGRLDAADVNISSVITAQTCINLLFRRSDLERAVAALRSESNPGVVTVTPIEDVAMIAAVGEGVRDRRGVAARVLGAVADAGVNALLAQAGASPVAVYVLVRSEDRERSVRAIHEVCLA